MMTDLDVAVLVVKSASVADDYGDRMLMLTEAMAIRPELPWSLAVEGLHKDCSEAYSWAYSYVHPSVS